jgi:hypothetical protein
MKLSMTGDPSFAKDVFELLDQQNVLELRLKNRLAQVFRAWCARHDSSHEISQARTGALQ